jgi:hypothetical protein
LSQSEVETALGKGLTFYGSDTVTVNVTAESLSTVNAAKVAAWDAAGVDGINADSMFTISDSDAAMISNGLTLGGNINVIPVAGDSVDAATEGGVTATVNATGNVLANDTDTRDAVADSLAVVGVGGIGANAIQGAKLAGAKRIIAIDPVEFKREKAMEFGATHTFSSMEEALPGIQELTWGTMANKVIMTMGVGSGEVIGSAMALASKRGRVVVTNIHPALEYSASMSLLGVKGDWAQDIREHIAKGLVTPFVPQNANMAIPESFDSATFWPQCSKSIGMIRDQSNCGCCWAFGGSEAASDRMCIATNASMLFPLSDQDICFNANYNGCGGGQISTPWTYISSKGVVTGGLYKDSEGQDTGFKGMCSDFSLPHCHHHGPTKNDPWPAEGTPGCPSEHSPQGPTTCDPTASPAHSSFAADKITFAGRPVSASGNLSER